MTNVENIFNLAYALITDTDLAKLSDEDLKDLSISFLTYATKDFKECKKDLSIVSEIVGEEDDLTEIHYINSDLTQEECAILAYGWLYYWMHHKVMYNRMLRNVINTKDFNSLSPANILLRMSELLEYSRREFLRARKRYSERYIDFDGWS